MVLQHRHGRFQISPLGFHDRHRLLKADPSQVKLIESLDLLQELHRGFSVPVGYTPTRPDVGVLGEELFFGQLDVQLSPAVSPANTMELLGHPNEKALHPMERLSALGYLAIKPLGTIRQRVSIQLNLDVLQFLEDLRGVRNRKRQDFRRQITHQPSPSAFARNSLINDA